ncbi:TonB-dependent receptor [Flavobacteriaceae bacterium]|nr:TonB-dependent receptor [Flavobacteriaceae bacterium]MDB9787386.1 TonB-dependent receptor [Flavobacteriaceae bacterium]
MKRILSMIAVLFSTIIFAQTTVTGSVSDENNNPIPGANVVANATTGTVADFDGNFSLSVDQMPPFSITVSSVGFDSVTVNVTASNLNFNVQLTESQNLLDEIVVSASRIAERLFESPVTIEKFDYKDIAQSTGADFYSSLEGLKGVQINSGGLFLQQVNTRGFSTVYNNGFVQLVDGMNNEAPGLGFSAGNLLGIHELDIQSVELMPGAASALYGANATKGILFMNSKNPFDFQGVSATYKHGLTSQEAAGENAYYDFAFRAANKFSDKFAAKVTVSYQEGEDWHAVDYRDINHLDGRYIDGTVEAQNPRDFPDYDGVNVYGDIGQVFDMTAAFRGVVLPSLAQQGLLSMAAAQQVSAIFGAYSPNFFGNYQINASGYNEVDLIDNKASSFKTDIAFHYKPTEDSEIILNSKMGTGNTMLHASNRNQMKNFSLQQHKIEYKNRNLGLRFYHTSESSGNTHDVSALGAVMTIAQPGGLNAYFGKYIESYFTALPGLIDPNPIVGLNTLVYYASLGYNLNDVLGKGGDLGVHAAARAAADTNMLVPGSAAWNTTYETAVSNGIDVFAGGAGILDTSQSNSFEADYNLQDLVEGVDIIVGASYRDYILRSNGTLFTDYDTPIEYTDMGLYAQAQKSVLGGAVKLTGSMRYDKSEFFEGTVTPRIGALINLSENQNIRVSYQTGFQNPAAQDQYIGLDIGQAVLMGSSPDNVDRFNMRLRGASGNSYTVTGNQVKNNSFTLASVTAGAPVAAGDLGNVGPQNVKSFDLGYRVNGKKTALDINAYYTKWDNFISAVNVITPLYGTSSNMMGLVALSQGDFKVFSYDANTDEIVNTYGVSAGFETSILNIFDLSGTYSYNKMEFDNPNTDYEAGFNTPENRVVLTLGSAKLANNFSFNVTAKYHDNFMWQQSGFIDAMIPARTTFDASMLFQLPSLNSRVKIGGTNLGGEEYFMMPGSGAIGSQFYVGLTINP